MAGCKTGCRGREIQRTGRPRGVAQSFMQERHPMTNTPQAGSGVTEQDVDAALDGMRFTATGIPKREDVRRALEQFAQSRPPIAQDAEPVFRFNGDRASAEAITRWANSFDYLEPGEPNASYITMDGKDAVNDFLLAVGDENAPVKFGDYVTREDGEFKILRATPANTAAGAGGEVGAIRDEIARLSAALKWYADGNHFNLEDDWDTVSGEPQNWLCGPDTGMVEDGGIARTVLAGGHMVEGDDELIAEPLMTPEQHTAKLARVVLLFVANPAPDSLEGMELQQLAGEIERYEKRVFNFANLPAPEQATTGSGQPSYRLLTSDDVIQRDDEFIQDDGVTWRTPVGWEIGARYGSVFKTARRPVLSTASPAGEGEVAK